MTTTDQPTKDQSAGNRPAKDHPAKDSSAGAATSLALAGAMVTTVANFGTAILVARAGAVFAGLFFAATAVVTILGNSAGLGTMTGLIYFLPQVRQATHPNPRSLIIVALRPVAIASSLAAVALYLGAGPVGRVVAGAQTAEIAGTLRILAPTIPAWALTVGLLGATRGLGSMTPTVAVNQVGRPLAQLVLVGLAIRLTDTPGAWAVALAWGIPIVGGAVAALIALWRLGGFARSGRPTVTSREFWRYNRPRSLSTTFQVALERLDVVLVSALAGPGAAGVYGTLTRYITAGNFLIFSLGQAAAPGLRRALAGPDPAAAQRLLRQATGWMVLVAWPYLLLVAVKSDPLIRLLNPGFGHRGTALVVLAVFMLVSALAGPVDLALLMLGRSRSSLLAVAVALSVNIGLDWLLVPRLGLVGAAVGWGLAVAFQNGLATWLVHRSGRLSAVGRPALVAATGATLAVVPIGVATPDTLAGLVVTVAVAGVIHLGWMARFASVLSFPTVSRLRSRLTRSGRRRALTG